MHGNIADTLINFTYYKEAFQRYCLFGSFLRYLYYALYKMVVEDGNNKDTDGCCSTFIASCFVSLPNKRLGGPNEGT